MKLLKFVTRLHSSLTGKCNYFEVEDIFKSINSTLLMIAVCMKL